MTNFYAWDTVPTLNQIRKFLTEHPEHKHLIFTLPHNQMPQWQPENEDEQVLLQSLQSATACLAFDAVNYVAQWQPETDLWLLPEHFAARLAEHFQQPENICWQTQPVLQAKPMKLKVWQLPPCGSKTALQPPEVLVIGAGIAGAATAYECAIRGARVTVLEAQQPAHAASGNWQGLLYAKISPHNTPQTELLLTGYGYTRRLLQQLLPEQGSWSACGVLHLNHNENERCRNDALAQNTHYHHLYYPMSAAEASELAGIPILQGGLFWVQGAWLNPPSLVHRLLQHERISVRLDCPAQRIEYRDGKWQAHTPQGIFSGSHIVFCTGADNAATPVINGFPFQLIRGQTDMVAAVSGSLKLKTALSAASYISPAWQGEHCFGATFIPNDADGAWRAEDEQQNRTALAKLNADLAEQFAPQLSGSLKKQPHAHSAVRCDCYDHLPAVGALGDADKMRQVYVKYALDKNYYLTEPCPYLPNAFANTAHGSRGLATAPICAAEIAAQICNTPRPLSERLRQALNPNRLIIRQIVHHQKTEKK